MNLRAKLVLVFVALAVLPMLAVSALDYRGGVRGVERLLRERAEERASLMAGRIARELDAHETRLLKLVEYDPVRAYVRDLAAARGNPDDEGKPGVPEAVNTYFTAFFTNNRERLESVTCFDSSGNPLLRAYAAPGGGGVEFQTKDFVSSIVGKEDERVWALAEPKALRSPVASGSYGVGLRVTAPVAHPPDSHDAKPAGAVVSEIKLKGVFDDAAGREAAPAQADDATARHDVVVLDNASGLVVYHTNSLIEHRESSAVMPHFEGLASRMRSGAEGHDFYDDGGLRRLAAFRQVRGLGLSLAAAEDYSAAVGPVRRAWLLGTTVTLAAGLAALGILLLIARRASSDIARVARAASAIAAGQLDQRIEVSASGETQELAESFNVMSDRLRELIAGEAETRQFQSFLRIAAMISHDLKNAIAGLSMLVSNMERQFHREEFRADAIESLREATEKLKRTVARLSEPAKSLSGEYRMAARQTDLVPIIRRVLATNAEPSRPLYDIEADLPDTLVAAVEPDRIENVVENLVINALEAMGSKGGRLTVEAGKLDGDLVFISVADTGVGMSDEFVKTRLFRPFSTTKNKGIGLGLFTCREIVEAHGGRLEVDSKAGAGTRFRVVLPSRLFRSGERQRRPDRSAASGATSAGAAAPR